MLKVNNLKIEYSKVLFQDMNFLLSKKEKVGLVGLNGCGKTTLLKILVGQEKSDEGTIVLDEGSIGYLPQEFDLPDDLFVGEFLEDLVEDIHSEMWQVDVIKSKLDFEVDDMQYISQLSGGERMKLYLIKILMQEPTVLLLDEPTNHLDIEGIGWFERFVKGFQGITIMISHDRAFLNDTVTKIFEIDEGKLQIFEGNYDKYLELKEVWKEKRSLAFNLQQKKEKQLNKMIEKAQIRFDGKTAKAAKKRLEREVESQRIDVYQEQKIDTVKFAGSVHNRKRILSLMDVDFGYGSNNDHPLTLEKVSSASQLIWRGNVLNKANFEMYGNEKVWFYGANGIGKSTVIKLIIGQISPLSGDVKIGDSLKWKYFSQDQSHLPAETTVHDYFMQQTGIPFGKSFGVLRKFLFGDGLEYYKIGSLSPGQRARLSFAIFAQQENDFLILDEPTNHLDIRSKEVIEEALRDFQGAIFLVSHDRYFVKNVGIGREVTIQDGKIL